MTYNVTISPSGRQFKVDIGTTVLEAALDQGIVLLYGCKDGATPRRAGMLRPQLVQ